MAKSKKYLGFNQFCIAAFLIINKVLMGQDQALIIVMSQPLRSKRCNSNTTNTERCLKRSDKRICQITVCFATFIISHFLRSTLNFNEQFFIVQL